MIVHHRCHAWSRILLVTRPDRFWNADHERVARLVTGGLVAASLAAITTVEVFHSLYYDGNNRILLTCSISR